MAHGTATEPTPRPAPLENVTISLTLHCNQGCQHCWVNAGPARSGELTNAEIDSLLRQARELGARHVKFTGGEPLVRAGFVDLVERAYHLGLRVSIETNAMALSAPMISTLSRFFTRLHFYVSLDGATASTHDSFRSRNGAFRRTIENLQLLRSAGGYFSIHTVARRSNLDQIPQIFRLAQRLGASQLKLILSIHQLGRGASAQDEAIQPDEVFALLAQLPPQRLWDYSWTPSRSRETALMTTLPPAFQPDGAGVTCGWSKSYLAILANGDVALCHGLYEVDEAKAGNVRDQPLAELWLQSGLFVETRDWRADDLAGVCGNCAVADTCRGLCRANAVARYHDLRAPYPFCQTMYDNGAFPRSMLRDPDCDSRYVGSESSQHAQASAVPAVPAGRRQLPLLLLDPAVREQAQ